MMLVYLLAASLIINGLFFICAALLKTDVFTDITYALSFTVLSVVLYAFYQPTSCVSLLVLASVLLWAFRLGGYLFVRILRIKVDHRFDDRRNSVIAFGSFWLLQAITVWLVMLPIFGITSNDARASQVPLVSIIAFGVLWLVGFVIQFIADSQKFIFKSKAENKDRFMNEGIWKYSRHPNYFGEIVMWWALALQGIFIYQGFQWLYFIGPVFISLMLIFVSGIPLLAKSAEAKWGTDPAYREYRAQTSLLIPLPPRNK